MLSKARRSSARVRCVPVPKLFPLIQESERLVRRIRIDPESQELEILLGIGALPQPNIGLGQILAARQPLEQEQRGSQRFFEGLVRGRGGQDRAVIATMFWSPASFGIDWAWPGAVAGGWCLGGVGLLVLWTRGDQVLEGIVSVLLVKLPDGVWDGHHRIRDEESYGIRLAALWAEADYCARGGPERFMSDRAILLVAFLACYRAGHPAGAVFPVAFWLSVSNFLTLAAMVIWLSRAAATPTRTDVTAFKKARSRKRLTPAVR